MSDVQRVGPVVGASGSVVPFTAGVTGGQRVLDAHGRYLSAVMEGRAFMLAGVAQAPTAYIGAGAGTPLAAIHNPPNSGKILSVLAIGLTLRAAATAAGQTGLIAWAGPSVIPTGTRTNPTNVLTQIATGSAALGFVNTALTGSTALLPIMPLFTYYWATAAAAFAAPGFFDVGGLVVGSPGNQIAIGVTVVPTSVTVDFSIIWEEIQNFPVNT